MKIVLKHIMRNIWAHKIRSLLILLALTISTSVLIIDIVLPDELYVKIEDTLRNVYGDADISITGGEPFLLDNLSKMDTEIEYTPSNGIDGTYLNGDPVEVFALDMNKAYDLKLISKLDEELKDNEIVISEDVANKKNYKIGDEITIKSDKKEFTFKVKQIIGKVGLGSLKSETDILFTDVKIVNELLGNKDNKYNMYYINVKNNDLVKDYYNYLNDNNEKSKFTFNNLVDIDNLKEEVVFVRYLMTLIFFMSTIMIFFVIASLNKITLAERIPVIGTFRSVGASRGKMNFILLLENMMYGLISGIAGSFLGLQLDSVVSKMFINADGVDLSTKGINMSLGLFIVGVLFAVLLEFFITAKEIMRTNKKPIKTLIFNTQNSRYKIRKVRTIIGFILIGLSFIIHILNKDINIVMTMASIGTFTIGLSSIVPLLLQIISKLFANLFKLIRLDKLAVASKNIGYNKMIVSSTRLVVVAITLLSSILLVSNAFTDTFTSFRTLNEKFEIIMTNTLENKEKYDKLVEFDEIKEVNYFYLYMDEKMTYNDNIKFSTLPMFYSGTSDEAFIINNKIEELQKDEIVIDEKVAFKNKLNVGDSIKISLPSIDKTYDFKIVGLCDSSNFTSQRNVIITNPDLFINELTDIPSQVLIKVNDNVNLDDLKEKLKKELKEPNIKIQTTYEYIDFQENQTKGIMGIFYVIIGLSVALSFIGIVNNQVISFINRRRELAVLNSTCMSKKQIKSQLLTETILANLIAGGIILFGSYVSTMFIDYFMQGIDMYIPIKYDILIVLKFILIIFVVLLFTNIIPSRKLKRMNIVNEIKYE